MDGPLCAGARATEPVEQRATTSMPSLPAFAVPHKRGWLIIPGPRGLLKPGPDLIRAMRMLPVERPELEHALNGLRHIESTAAHGCGRERGARSPAAGARRTGAMLHIGAILIWIQAFADTP